MALSLFEKVYRELDSTQIGAERKFVKGTPAERYNYLDEIGCNDYIISIWGPTEERLNFAKKVAEFYKAPYKIRERITKDVSRKFVIEIDTEE